MKKFNVESIVHYENHVVLSLLPINGRSRVSFTPGQYATLSYQRENSTWSPVRSFSITNSPEGSGRLEFAFRITGAFTKGLSELGSGDIVRIQGPFGEFLLPHNQADVVMIAGGIGITPMLSMLRSVSENDRNNYTLLYSCRNASDVPFLDELRSLANKHSNISVYTFLSSLPSENDSFIQGPITQKHLAKLVGNNAMEFSYYICGPEDMMRILSMNLEHLGASPNSILTESFATGNKTSRKLFGLSPVQLSYATGLALFVALVGVIGFKDIQADLVNQSSDVVQSDSTTEDTTETKTTDESTTNSETEEQEDDSQYYYDDTTENSYDSSNDTTQTSDSQQSDYTNTYRSPRSSVS